MSRQREISILNYESSKPSLNTIRITVWSQESSFDTVCACVGCGDEVEVVSDVPLLWVRLKCGQKEKECSACGELSKIFTRGLAGNHAPCSQTSTPPKGSGPRSHLSAICCTYTQSFLSALLITKPDTDSRELISDS